MTPKKNDLYKHKHTQTIYRVVMVIPIKLNFRWEADGLVVYRGTTGTYARLTQNFLEVFEYVPKSWLAKVWGYIRGAF